VDGLNLAFRWKHSRKPEDMVFDFTSTIKSLARSYDCGQIIVLCDAGSDWRRSIHPGYKSTRKAKFADQDDKEKQESEEFFEFYERALFRCREADIPTIRLKGVEADDIAAYIVENKYELDINTIWLISSDRDWDLLIEEDVSRFSTVTRSEMTMETWDYPCSTEDYISYKTLVGDKGDDIPGVDGVGPVKASQLIEKYGSIFDIIASMPIPGTAKYIANLNASADQMLLSYELMDLRSFNEVAIGDQLESLKEQLGEIYGKV
tara:strand:+ start:3518 stop:4306 length:789 start_codon:yes stop_codon:yes gene_type:complete